MQDDYAFYWQWIVAMCNKEPDRMSDPVVCIAEAERRFDLADTYSCWTKMRRRLIGKAWMLVRRALRLNDGNSPYNHATPLGWKSLQAYYRKLLNMVTRQSPEEAEMRKALTIAKNELARSNCYDKRKAAHEKLQHVTKAYAKVTGFSYQGVDDVMKGAG